VDLVQIIKIITHILLTVVIILFIITGYGITNYHIIETITFGALSKPDSYQIHSALVIPLIILLIMHISFSVQKKYNKKIQI